MRFGMKDYCQEHDGIGGMLDFPEALALGVALSGDARGGSEGRFSARNFGIVHKIGIWRGSRNGQI